MSGKAGAASTRKFCFSWKNTDARALYLPRFRATLTYEDR